MRVSFSRVSDVARYKSCNNQLGARIMFEHSLAGAERRRLRYGRLHH